tara:strand:- start:318 stop:1949 length:1632 start_codon:yes stop_codon:yes gene_type:complete
MCGIFAFLQNLNGTVTNKDQLLQISVALKSKHRGPDNTVIMPIGPKSNNLFVFHRLSIMDTSMEGAQPMMHPNDSNIILICNGEIYNNLQLKEKYKIKTKSGSDCEVILHLYQMFGIEKTVKLLDGVFAFIIYDGNTNTFYAGRDSIGVRSMYIGYTKDNSIVISSELKSVSPLCLTSRHFMPGTWWCSKKPRKFNFFNRLQFSYYTTLSATDYSELEVSKKVVSLLETAVHKRMMSEREIGCFLSGGLDSSLVTALVAKEYDDPKKLHTYSIGMEGSTDLYYADMVAKYIGTTHHEVIVTEDDMLQAIPEVVRMIESYDTTTVRASTPMYLLSKWIKQNTNTTVVFSGEGSDELSGSYMYFHNCPNVRAFQTETSRLVQDLFYFDVLRCDKSVAGAGLEPRVPFLDMDFINYYMQIPPEYKLPRNGIEKYFLRKAFEPLNLLPSEVLWRTKEAFSDGVSAVENSWNTIIKHFVDKQITDETFTWQKDLYNENTPSLKETLFYRRIFDEEYPNCAHLVPYYWLPKWTDDVDDPSARVLSVYNK